MGRGGHGMPGRVDKRPPTRGVSGDRLGDCYPQQNSGAERWGSRFKRSGFPTSSVRLVQRLADA